MTSKSTCIGYANINNETIFEVGKFAILWNIFEDIKCGYFCTCDKIVNMGKSTAVLAKEPLENFALVLSSRASKIMCDVNTYVNNYLFPSNGARISPNDKAVNIPIVIDFIESAGKNKWEGALLAIFRIRNNMFHGLKDHNELNDQIDLFKAMNAVLEEVIK